MCALSSVTVYDYLVVMTCALPEQHSVFPPGTDVETVDIDNPSDDGRVVATFDVRQCRFLAKAGSEQLFEALDFNEDRDCETLSAVEREHFFARAIEALEASR